MYVCMYVECRGFESHSRQLNFSKKKWAVLSAVELFALHLRCCSSVIHVCICATTSALNCRFLVCFKFLKMALIVVCRGTMAVSFYLCLGVPTLPPLPPVGAFPPPLPPPITSSTAHRFTPPSHWPRPHQHPFPHVPRQPSDTLIVRKIPRESNTITKLSSHFEKFGTIVNLTVSCFMLDTHMHNTHTYITAQHTHYCELLMLVLTVHTHTHALSTSLWVTVR